MCWTLFLFLFLVAWFLQNVIHESSHLLIGWLVEGRKPLKMIPWPSVVSGRLYFARYENGPATRKGSPRWRHVAPLYTACLIMNVMCVLLFITGNLYFIPFIISALVDSSVWMFGYIFRRPGTDGFFYQIQEVLDRGKNGHVFKG